MNEGQTSAWPKITVITPSFQQGGFLEETIRSVLGQEYPHLEFIIIDGGSTDGSVDIIRRYADRLAYWVSEKDAGQTDAINKGLRQSTGDVWSYLNSDDLLEPGCLHTVGRLFASHPELDWISGSTRVFGEDMPAWKLIPAPCQRALHYLMPWHRPSPYVFPASVSCFMSRRVLDKLGPFDADLHYSMDMEYYTRASLVAGFQQTIIPDVLGAWRVHPQAKTWREGCAYGGREDELAIAERFIHMLEPNDRRILADEIAVQKKALAPRKAMWLMQQGQRWHAFRELLRSLGAIPSSMWFRPWLGAMRRCVLS